MSETLLEQDNLEQTIEKIWQLREHNISHHDAFIEQTLSLIDQGKIRVAYKEKNQWHVHQWLKKAIILTLKAQTSNLMSDNLTHYFDKIMPKFSDWQEQDFINTKIRAVPGAIVRKHVFLEENVILMPCFINIGAFIGKNTMIDNFAAIGSCAQIGRNCHISQHVGIAGVIEPIQSNPVIIEDNCFIGSGCQIAEGVIIKEGAVLGMGVKIGASTKIVNRKTGAITYGVVPKNAVVVPGSIMDENNIAIACAVIVKQVDSQTRQKTAINDLLRD